MQVKLVTKAEPHMVPVANTMIGTVNNVLPSLIANVRIHVNNIPGKCFSIGAVVLTVKPATLFQSAPTTTTTTTGRTFWT
jgi:hypothetical protein